MASHSFRVLVTRRLPETIERALSEQFDTDLRTDDRPWDPAQLQQALRDADAVLGTVTDPFTAEVLAVRPMRCRLLANFGVGVNHVDLAAARAAGLTVTNTPGVLTDATADLTMALLLMVTRRAGEGERLLRAGRWEGWAPTQLLGRSLGDLTLGIVGMGRIGRAVARRALAGFGMRIRYWTPRDVPEDAWPARDDERCETLEMLLESVDVVSLHCPATPETYHLLNAARLARMRPGSWLLNTARGTVVDEAALAEALVSGHLAGAGLDVYEDEPRVHPALLGLEQVVLLPHLGSATREARESMGWKALENLVAFATGRPVPDPV